MVQPLLFLLFLMYYGRYQNLTYTCICSMW